jgi:hypothetical protein
MVAVVEGGWSCGVGVAGAAVAQALRSRGSNRAVRVGSGRSIPGMSGGPAAWFSGHTRRVRRPGRLGSWAARQERCRLGLATPCQIPARRELRHADQRHAACQCVRRACLCTLGRHSKSDLRGDAPGAREAVAPGSNPRGVGIRRGRRTCWTGTPATAGVPDIHPRTVRPRSAARGASVCTASTGLERGSTSTCALRA